MAILKTEIKGKRFKKRIETTYSHDFEGITAACEQTESFSASLVRHVAWAKAQLSERGFDTELPVHFFRGKYFEPIRKNDPLFKQKLKQRKLSGLFIEDDSEESELVVIWESAERALNENNDINARLANACKFGDYMRRIIVYRDYGRAQRKITKQKRNKEVHDLIKKLASEDLPAKELWSKFFGVLDENGHEPRESRSELKYTYTKSNGKEGKITFSTFQNLLSKARES